VHTSEDWIDFEKSVTNHLAGNAVEALLAEGVSFKDLQSTYQDIIREAAVIAGSKSDTVKATVAAGLALANMLSMATSAPGKTAELYHYTVRGWGSKSDIESQTGISLTWKWEGIDGLGAFASKNYDEFGKSLNAYALARLAEQYAGHPELAEKIAQHRERSEHNTEVGPDVYLAEMHQAAERLLRDSSVQQVLKTNSLAKETFAFLHG
jgi:hypothetical protein